VFTGVFIAEEVAVRLKGSGDTTMVDVKIFLKAYLNMFLRSACLTDEAFFLVKSKTSSIGPSFLKCQVIRIS
jgi:hypothetical protein